MSDTPPAIGTSWFARNISVPTLLVLAGLFFTGVTTYRDMQNSISTLNDRIQESGNAAETQYNTLSSQIQQLSVNNIPYRITVVEEQLKQTNARVDQAALQTTALFEAIRKDISLLSTRVEVLAQRLETAQDRRQTELLGPVRP